MIGSPDVRLAALDFVNKKFDRRKPVKLSNFEMAKLICILGRRAVGGNLWRSGTFRLHDCGVVCSSRRFGKCFDSTEFARFSLRRHPSQLRPYYSGRPSPSSSTMFVCLAATGH